jgi:hypothetical protein
MERSDIRLRLLTGRDYLSFFGAVNAGAVNVGVPESFFFTIPSGVAATDSFFASSFFAPVANAPVVAARISEPAQAARIAVFIFMLFSLFIFQKRGPTAAREWQVGVRRLVAPPAKKVHAGGLRDPKQINL